MGIVNNFLDWLEKLLETKDEYGLTSRQREDVLWHAGKGEEGRDFAERLGVQAFGMDVRTFYKLLTDHGISTR